jgi:cellulose synthase/poly-beta-1,6-N-acetylglucosamine synthase-like glycosyltransferase
VTGLCITSFFIWAETYLAFGAQEAPAKPAKPYPSASAIITAYLPNEADTILETLDHFLEISYPNRLQIILAYNSPKDMPIEQDLMVLAERHAHFLPHRVHSSTSKAQNVNSAIAQCTGEFVGIFDADHWPDPGSFERAWRWLSNGFDIVQGHCLIRNGDDSWVARMVAVEFETIYAILFPGRAVLHDFGIFSGSNGYWKTELLHHTRMNQFMLTEDIDSSFRVVNAGYKIASDRDLISRELAPTKLQQLWNQRLRWAQGWLQSSIRWFMPSLTSGRLSTRQKFGIAHLSWRELYAWVSIQVFFIIMYWISTDGWESIDWLVSIFVAATLLKILTGLGQVICAYFLAHPTIRSRSWWWCWYLFISFVFYTGYKNLITRVAHIKELMRERVWQVTPRTRRAHVEPVPSTRPDL